jgi:ribonuclease VapC
MVIDTSAIIAILFDEPEGDSLLERIVDDQTRLMSAASFVEAGIVADRDRNRRKGAALDALLASLSVRIEPVTEEHAREARSAYRRFGRGIHPAGSILAIASAMRSAGARASRCCSRATTSCGPMSQSADSLAAIRAAVFPT